MSFHLTRKRALWSGLLLIALTNAVTLGLVAHNRSGEPESALQLTEREFDRPWDWRSRGRENSGLSLKLLWRLAPGPVGTEADEPTGDPEFQWDYRQDASWLDEAKLIELGFPAADPDRRRQPNRARPVMLVLEIDGPAYQEALDRARRHLADEIAVRDADPERKEFINRVKTAEKRLADEETIATRLYVVDAGLAVEALRQRYPDRSRYAIVNGFVRPSWTGRKPPLMRRGYIDRIDVEINVPKELRNTVPDDTLRRRSGAEASRFRAEIAFGQRLEPWMRTLSAVSD